VPNLKLAYYKLLGTEEGDLLKEIVPEKQVPLLSEYESEYYRLLDGHLVENANGDEDFCGPAVPSEGSLIEYLTELYVKLAKDPEKCTVDLLGKGTYPVMSNVLRYSRPFSQKGEEARRMKVAQFLRRHLFFNMKGEHVYTVVAEFKRALKKQEREREAQEQAQE